MRFNNSFNINRRTFMKRSLAFGLGSCLFPYGRISYAAPKRKKVLVLGIDGMDPHLTNVYLHQGLLPNVRRVIEKGNMLSLATSTPPQSPVAWSNVTVGASAAVHGVYDFIHREPETMRPYLSTSRVKTASRLLHIGDYAIPLSRGQTVLLRQGRPFWEYLADRDIPTTIFKMPANFPCESEKVDMVSGMGTPDLRGGYGSFTVFTSAPKHFTTNLTGGRIIPVEFNENQITTHLPGPTNTLKKGNPESVVPMTIWRDRVNPVVRILLQDHELLLQEGEWSGWLQLAFPMIGSLVDVKGICKIYVKRVHPHFSLYVSPINIDPSDPALPVVSSERYGRLLTESNGFFYTQGFPEDTKALSEGILNETEYLELAQQIIAERKQLLDFEIERFNTRDQGILFFYFSSLDQNSHMYWRAIDPEHPLYTPDIHKTYGTTLKTFYAEVDAFLGGILHQYDIHDPEFTLMIMSDHGFVPFRRQVNLNTWLYKNGYLALSKTDVLESGGYFAHVNWKRTGAYNLGINSIYLNIQGREQDGTVVESQAKGLRESLRQELLHLIDPATGAKAVSQVWIVPETERKRHPHAPDLIVGWNYGYRTSWESILGGFTPEVFSDNLDKWSGDHCVAPSLVPAILITNRQVTKPQPSLCDIAPTILEEFLIPQPEAMEGKPLYIT
jgi:predicted AlkP superfamily phosphohydrolase/phosphomutase